MLKFQNSLKINTKTFAQLPNLAYICKRIKEVIYTANSLKGERQLHNKRQKLK